MFRQLFLLDNNSEKTFYRKNSNKLNKIIVLSEKKSWDLIRSSLPTKTDGATSILDHFEAECVSIEPITVTNCFNNFFSNGKLTQSNLDFLQLFIKRVSPIIHQGMNIGVSASLYLDNPSVSEVINAIYSLNVNKAVGLDNISAVFVRVAATLISSYLQYFIDFFFKNRIFPESCTLAKVIPLHEKDSKLDPYNYWPISILTCFSKILERLIYYRLQEFLKKHSVIHK